MVVSRHIVIAEHDDDVRTLLEQVVLHTYPFATISSVADGVAALGTFRQKGARLLLIDAELPQQTGLDVVRELRSFDATVPIIVLSVDDMVAKQALSIGATFFVAKPFGMSEMMQTLLEVLPLEQAYEG
jgi:DNA-binding response OmpR family regulator